MEDASRGAAREKASPRPRHGSPSAYTEAAAGAQAKTLGAASPSRGAVATEIRTTNVTTDYPQQPAMGEGRRSPRQQHEQDQEQEQKQKQVRGYKPSSLQSLRVETQLETNISTKGTKTDDASIEQAGGEEHPRMYNAAHVDKLYLDHIRHKVTIAAATEQLQAVECPFVPQITHLAAKFASPRGEHRYDRLYKGAQIRDNRLQEKRRALDPECSFKPVITPKAARRRQLRGRGGKTGVFDRLHATAERTQQSLEAKRKLLDPECSFTPKTNSNRGRGRGRGSRGRGGRGGRRNSYSSAGSSSNNNTSHTLDSLPVDSLIHSIYQDPHLPPPDPARLCPDKQTLQNSKRKMERRKVELDLRECTFQPKLVTRRLRYGQVAQQKPLEIRSAAVLAKREARRIELKLKLDERDMKECTFAPKRNSTRRQGEKTTPLYEDEVNRLSWRLYSDARRWEAKRRLVLESLLAQQAAASVHRHLSKWNMQRISFLHASGTKKLAQRLAHSRDAEAKHSLDVERELEDLKECTFAPKIEPLSQKLDALLLHRCDPAGSPRHVRLYKDAHRLRLHLDELKHTQDQRIDDDASTAFDASSPKFRKQRKLKSDHEQSMRLYEDARRIEERKERLYHHLRVQEEEKRNIRYNAHTIKTVDREIRRNGRVSPANLISPRSPVDQQKHLVSMHERHVQIQNALQTVRTMLDKEERARNETKFSAETITFVDELRLTSPSAYDVRKARNIVLQAKPVVPTSPQSTIPLEEAISPRAKLEQQPKFEPWRPGSTKKRDFRPNKFDTESDGTIASIWRPSSPDLLQRRNSGISRLPSNLTINTRASVATITLSDEGASVQSEGLGNEEEKVEEQDKKSNLSVHSSSSSSPSGAEEEENVLSPSSLPLNDQQSKDADHMSIHSSSSSSLSRSPSPKSGATSSDAPLGKVRPTLLTVDTGGSFVQAAIAAIEEVNSARSQQTLMKKRVQPARRLDSPKSKVSASSDVHLQSSTKEASQHLLKNSSSSTTSLEGKMSLASPASSLAQTPSASKVPNVVSATSPGLSLEPPSSASVAMGKKLIHASVSDSSISSLPVAPAPGLSEKAQAPDTRNQRVADEIEENSDLSSLPLSPLTTGKESIFTPSLPPAISMGSPNSAISSSSHATSSKDSKSGNDSDSSDSSSNSSGSSSSSRSSRGSSSNSSSSNSSSSRSESGESDSESSSGSSDSDQDSSSRSSSSSGSSSDDEEPDSSVLDSESSGLVSDFDSPKVQEPESAHAPGVIKASEKGSVDRLLKSGVEVTESKGDGESGVDDLFSKRSLLSENSSEGLPDLLDFIASEKEDFQSDKEKSSGATKSSGTTKVQAWITSPDTSIKNSSSKNDTMSRSDEKHANSNTSTKQVEAKNKRGKNEILNSGPSSTPTPSTLKSSRPAPVVTARSTETKSKVSMSPKDDDSLPPAELLRAHMEEEFKKEEDDDEADLSEDSPPPLLLREGNSHFQNAKFFRRSKPMSPSTGGSSVIQVKIGDKVIQTTVDDVSDLGSLGSLDIDAFLEQVENDEGPDEDILKLLE